ncbi:uncharacterized protein LOC130495515 [Raphanus sativus]|uniref:Uncharacterized protein LOC130495515 n=1 Tax=Raphanus sativus TaxID=3726 RepID=A0A9W3BUM6_RAPSA|nr:uncharacterized protein LOC130495515 [Raphanus sativus]
MKSPPDLYGAKATISVWKPEIEKGADEMSISQIWISSGRYITNNLNTIEVGWQSDGYNKTGCYNLRCGGFVQTNNNIVLGGSISPVSTFNGNQFEISVFVWKDRLHGNWWLSLGDDNTLVGYWPAEIFTTLADHAGLVQWGGEITNAQTFGRHTTTQMGSGRFPEEGFRKASYFRNLEIVDHNNSLLSIESIDTQVDDPKLYDLNNHFTDEWGSYFFYGGGPGSSRLHSGAVRSSLNSFYVYLCFGFLFIN